MRTFIGCLAAVALVGTLGACGPGGIVGPGGACLKLFEPAGASLLTTAPARVSLLFGVETCDGNPIAGLEAGTFKVLEDDKPLSELESQRAIRPKGQRFHMSSIVLIDLSGSVLKSGQFGELKEAAGRYLQTVLDGSGNGQRVALLTFDGRSQPQVVVDFTDSLPTALAGLDSLERRECSVASDCNAASDARTCAGWRCVDDSTNLNGAVVAALRRLSAEDSVNTDVIWRDSALVVFTDGSDQAARVPTEVMLSEVEKSKAHIFTVGMGAEVDDVTLKSIGRDGAFSAPKAAQLGQAFEAVATRVKSLAYRFYLLEYCSPKRGGTHTLKVTATITRADGVVLQGGLSRDFDADGFTSGCSL